MLTIKTLENTTIKEITETFNESFSDYSTPVVFKEEQFVEKFALEGGRLDLSVGAFDNGALVAFILHFIDHKDGESFVYNGGTGVIPSHRGNRLTSKLYDFILPKLKEARIENLVLEVFTDNYSASKIYQNRGFQIQREVCCFRGSINKSEPSKIDPNYQIVELTELDWDLLQSFWDYPPTWQNSVSTMKNAAGKVSVLGVQANNELCGYMIYDPRFKRIHQLAISQKHRRKGLANSLFNYIQDLEKEPITLINIDSRIGSIQQFLEKRGMNNFVNQFEMEMKLT